MNMTAGSDSPLRHRETMRAWRGYKAHPGVPLLELCTTTTMVPKCDSLTSRFRKFRIFVASSIFPPLCSVD